MSVTKLNHARIIRKIAFFVSVFIFGLISGRFSSEVTSIEKSDVKVLSTSPNNSEPKDKSQKLREITSNGPKIPESRVCDSSIPDFVILEFEKRNIDIFNISEVEWLAFKNSISIYEIANFVIGNGMAVFEHLIKNNDVERIAVLLRRGAPINATYFSGRSPIEFAAEHSTFDTFEFLINNGAEILLEPSNQKRLNILLAARANPSLEEREKIVSYLLGLGVSEPVSRDLFFKSVKDQLSTSELSEIIEQLDINYEVTLNINALEQGIRAGLTDEQLALFSDDKLYALASGSGYNPLHAAGFHTNLSRQGLSKLVAYGSDINGVDVVGMTPIMYMCLSGNIEGARALIELGANIDVSDNYGRRPIDLINEELDESARAAFERLLSQ